MKTTTLSNCVLLLAILICSQVEAQVWSGILQPARAIEWSNVGIPGGVPNRTAICANISAATYGSGSTDATAGIQSALNSCSANSVVLLSAGRFLINGALTIPGNVTLRGAGANATILDAHGTGNGVVNVGPITFPNVSASTAVNAGATRGSTSFSVASAAAIGVGTYLMITELNDPAYVTIKGGEGDCTWCDGGLGFNGTRVRGQIMEVTSVSGTTIGFTPPLYSDYPNTPQVAPIAMAKKAGVESLQVYANNTGYQASFEMISCAYCWIKGVEANYTDGDFVQVQYGYRDEIRDSYFSNAFKHTSGSTDSDIFIIGKTSASLIENNIIERSHAAIVLNWGAAGNVISYNFDHGGFDQYSPTGTGGGISLHGAHPQFNLLEGNQIVAFAPDQIWGSSSHNTLFRNSVRGTTLACNPILPNARGTVICSPLGFQWTPGVNGWWEFQHSRAMEISHLALYYNFVGNVVGSDQQNALIAYGYGSTHVAILQYPGVRSYDSTNYNWNFGYGESADDGVSGSGCAGSTVTPCHSTDAFNTAFMHGNYTNANGITQWASGITQTLPSSFYLSAKPTWWKSTLAFPAIGPDISGSVGAGGHARTIPAQDCYINTMGGAEGGAGSPLAFNANDCYYAPSSGPPAPTGLAVIVR